MRVFFFFLFFSFLLACTDPGCFLYKSSLAFVYCHHRDHTQTKPPPSPYFLCFHVKRSSIEPQKLSWLLAATSSKALTLESAGSCVCGCVGVCTCMYVILMMLFLSLVNKNKEESHQASVVIRLSREAVLVFPSMQRWCPSSQLSVSLLSLSLVVVVVVFRSLASFHCTIFDAVSPSSKAAPFFFFFLLF